MGSYKTISVKKLITCVITLFILQVIPLIMLYYPGTHYGLEFNTLNLVDNSIIKESYVFDDHQQFDYSRTKVNCGGFSGKNIPSRWHYLCNNTFNYLTPEQSKDINELFYMSCASKMFENSIAAQIFKTTKIPTEQRKGVPKEIFGETVFLIKQWCKDIVSWKESLRELSKYRKSYYLFGILAMITYLTFLTKLMPKSKVPWLIAIIFNIIACYYLILLIYKGGEIKELVNTPFYNKDPVFSMVDLETEYANDQDTDKILNIFQNIVLDPQQAANSSTTLFIDVVDIGRNNLSSYCTFKFCLFLQMFSLVITFFLLPRKTPKYKTLDPPDVADENDIWDYLPAAANNNVQANVDNSEDAALMDGAEEWLMNATYQFYPAAKSGENLKNDTVYKPEKQDETSSSGDYSTSE